MRNFLNEFAATVEDAFVHLSELSDEESAVASKEGKWCPKEIIGHLIDSATNNHQRFVRAQMQDDLVFSGYDQERWVDLQRYRDSEWSELLVLWRSYNRHLINVMHRASDEALKRPRENHNLNEIAWQTVPAGEPVTLEYFMRDYIGHLKNHLQQIFQDQIPMRLKGVADG